ncbi:hypothetical protein EYF80_024433 [Liparis tanakae]|uniref:Uncharacterized protein n=1 Tax=Liparis tanakae TaxID=230148 RepID=A0A4Z2HHA9_9TELE|nr:hypothetical protein EYF80_024433 [Liparis tanakae]
MAAEHQHSSLSSTECVWNVDDFWWKDLQDCASRYGVPLCAIRFVTFRFSLTGDWWDGKEKVLPLILLLHLSNVLLSFSVVLLHLLKKAMLLSMSFNSNAVQLTVQLLHFGLLPLPEALQFSFSSLEGGEGLSHPGRS